MLSEHEIEKLNADFDRVKRRIGTISQDSPEFYRAMDSVMELAGQRLDQINYNGK